MKNLLLFVCVLSFAVFSCSDEQDESLQLSEDINKITLENEAKFAYTTSSKMPTDVNVCNSVLIIGEGNKKVGYLDFAIGYNQVIITYKIFEEYSLVNTNLSVNSTSNNDFPMDHNGNPMIDNFEIKESFENNVNEITYYIDQDFYAEGYYYAAHAVVVDHLGQEVNAWGYGNKFTSNEMAMYTGWLTEKCGEIYQTCFDLNNIDMYIPLQDSTSGVFPSAGSHADVVTLTPDSPESSGNLEVVLEFNEIPQKFGSATLIVTFDDLDLNQDLISAYGNTVAFSELFELRDENNKLLATLDELSNVDGNFTYYFKIPNEVFSNNKKTIQLHAMLSANLLLLDGSGIQVENTIESMIDISLCGINLGTIEE